MAKGDLLGAGMNNPTLGVARTGPMGPNQPRNPNQPFNTNGPGISGGLTLPGIGGGGMNFGGGMRSPNIYSGGGNIPFPMTGGNVSIQSPMGQMQPSNGIGPSDPNELIRRLLANPSLRT